MLLKFPTYNHPRSGFMLLTNFSMFDHFCKNSKSPALNCSCFLPLFWVDGIDSQQKTAAQTMLIFKEVCFLHI